MDDSTPRIDPAHTALLVMDFQRGIVDRAPDAEALLERVRATIDVARAAGATIGYVRVAFTDDELGAVPLTNKSFSALASGRGAAMHADAPETGVHDRVAPRDGDVIVRKRRVGAFSTTDLADQLAARGVDTLVLAGISTSGVVLSTIRDAADRDFRLYVVADGCADFDPEVHDVLMTKVFPRQAWVISAADLPALLTPA